jgi:hypothetical protein
MRRFATAVCVLLALQLSAAPAKTKKKTTVKKAVAATAATATAFTPADGVPITHVSNEKRKGPDEIYPNVAHNPGAIDPAITQENIADNICNKDFKTGTVRPLSSYTTQLKKKQMADIYDFTAPQSLASLGGADYDEDKCVPRSNNARCYEEDHIVSLQNGGAPSDPRNLFPEAYNSFVKKDHVGAREKDKVENYVHNGICLAIPNAKFSSGPKPSKRLTLEEGQRILAIDWYACYQSLADGMNCVPPD